ncbi:D-inositol 3-phosphate glycosyltransferase-like [Acropora palmata]|uniref:D-inositol 3-phosphate glycosyltransferase-like n=1 Tax=Acropora palmata TaxID=6131 RepID=UPI003DA1881B
MASNVCPPHEHDPIRGSSKLQVTILASEWGSSKGGLSTLNRELAIQLAKFSCVEVTFFLLQCSDEDKKAAASYSVSIHKAERRPGYRDELDWLSFPPENLRIDVVVGHGVKLCHQAQVIRNSHKCKWVQIVHTDPEELGMFKCYENPISTGERKHHDEVELCQMADFVVSIGPKLTKAFRGYLSWCKKDVFSFTPGVFDDFSNVQEIPVNREQRNILVFGRGDAEDFELKGFDIAARSVGALSDTRLYFVGASHGEHEEIAKRFVDLGIPANRLKVRGYVDSREDLKRLFCEVDLVLMPSRTEGFGLTGLEGLSAGLPVLVSKNSGFGEALSSIPCGSLFVIDSEDPSTWTAGIKGIWNRDRKSQLDEVKAVRRSYGERYSWSEQCQHLIEKMFKVVHGTSSVPEVTAQVVGARKQKLNEEFTGIQGKVSKFTAGRSGSRVIIAQLLFSHMWFIAASVRPWMGSV